MKRIYLDNASTTAIRPEVLLKMGKVLQEEYGNPSSLHSFGRTAKSLMEISRKSIAKQINANPQEIIFTSGGTEADNWIIRSVVKDLKIKRIITSRIEHHAVLYSIESVQKEYNVKVDYIDVASNGDISIPHLEALLSSNELTLVSLMHVNNEIGNILDIEKVSRICKQYNALFHSDTIQSIGKISIDVQRFSVDFLVASAHKFHGPKGVGFAYIRKNNLLQPMIFGGKQEKGLRAGTESVHNLVGMATALEYSYKELEKERAQIIILKEYAIQQLESHFPGVKINGNTKHSFYSILNVLLPFSEDKTAMILFHLDMKGIAVSRGSACQSGVVRPSHVLKEILSEKDIRKPSLRISFSHYNTKRDIDILIEGLKTV